MQVPARRAQRPPPLLAPARPDEASARRALLQAARAASQGGAGRLRLLTFTLGRLRAEGGHHAPLAAAAQPVRIPPGAVRERMPLVLQGYSGWQWGGTFGCLPERLLAASSSLTGAGRQERSVAGSARRSGALDSGTSSRARARGTCPASCTT